MESKPVTKGQLILEFDKRLLYQKGYDDTVIFVVTNSDDYKNIIMPHAETADHQHNLITAVV